MSTDTKAIIGTIVGTGLVLGGLLINQNASLHTSLNTRIDDLRTDLTGRIDDLRTNLTGRIAGLRADPTNRIDNVSGDVDDLRTDVRDMTTRLRNVEIAFGKVDQRLLTLERAIIPAAEAPP